MSDNSDQRWYLVAGAIIGLVVGFQTNNVHEWYLKRERAGFELVDGAPWCAVDSPGKRLVCRYFSKDHCGIGAIMDEVRGPTGPLCVPRPK